jgi:hypothetical protein
MMPVVEPYICDQLRMIDDGTLPIPVVSFATIMDQAMGSAGSGARVILAAVYDYCPQYEELVS